MVHYLIEFRFSGKAKSEFKRLSYLLNSKFKLGFNNRNRPIPHISLVGPFSTNNEKKLISDFKKCCEKYNLIHFRISGFNSFSSSKVVYIDISPTQELKNLRWELSKKLKSYCKLKNIDLNKEFYFHNTLAMHLPEQKFNKILKFTKNLKEPKFKYLLTRITIIKNSKILCEYDFVLRRLLFRKSAKNPGLRKKTNKNIRKVRQQKSKKNIFERIMNFFK